MSDKQKQKDALDYHSQSPAGKIAVHPTKSVLTQVDLSLAYSPGVAEPCRKIHASKEDVYTYTAKGNLVAVISNGTAVLGLGDIGPEASKPVMEGKGVLFKKFAGIDVFDLEVDEKDPQAFVQIVKALSPTFGGINLEDIKAPESFLIEESLRNELQIPVMHDDQHGTAIISAAAMLNALEIVGKKIEKVKIVVNGAGAAAIACANLYLSLGAVQEHIVMIDSKGVIRKDRADLSSLKLKYATERDLHSLEEAVDGADVFLGLSRGNVLSEQMLLKMAKDPIVFALANPDPEIKYSLALGARSDVVMATGRSDHPNQVNNVLGFPYIFRGALDVRATCINEEMKLAAVRALAELAKKPVPEAVAKAYGKSKIVFGREYFIPKPLDPRLIYIVSTAVAKAAMSSGVSRLDIYDWENYKQELQRRIGMDTGLLAQIVARATKNPKRIAFADAESPNVLKATRMIMDEGIAKPVLIGDKRRIYQLLDELQLPKEDVEVMDPIYEESRCSSMASVLFEKRQRRGITLHRASHLVQDPDYFGSLLLEMGEVDSFISGSIDDYGHVLRVALEVIGPKDGVDHIAGMYILSNAQGTYFLSDTSVNISPNASLIAEIATLSAQLVRHLNQEPRVALLSYSNFGSGKGEVPQKMREALKILRQTEPDLVVDGELQANVAISSEILREMYSFSLLRENPANVLIFPDLSAGNIAYKLLLQLGKFEAIGPLLMGMRKPVHILQQGASVREIFNLASFATVDAQSIKESTNT